MSYHSSKGVWHEIYFKSTGKNGKNNGVFCNSIVIDPEISWWFNYAFNKISNNVSSSYWQT